MHWDYLFYLSADRPFSLRYFWGVSCETDFPPKSGRMGFYLLSLYNAMHNLLVALKKGMVGTDAIDATLTAYNTSCGEMRSEARDAFIYSFLGINLEDFN